MKTPTRSSSAIIFFPFQNLFWDSLYGPPDKTAGSNSLFSLDFPFFLCYIVLNSYFKGEDHGQKTEHRHHNGRPASL